MSFVNEPVPDEDKQRIDFSRFTSPRTGAPLRPFRWTIDRERNVFLMWLINGGPDDQDAQYFLFGWKSVVFHICLERVYDLTSNISRWSLNEFYPPQNIQVARAEMLSALKDALSIYGDRHQKDSSWDSTEHFNF